jgi:hypothetical protein
MTVQEYTDKLQALIERKNNVIEETNGIYKDIQNNCTIYLKDRIKVEVENAVKNHPQITKSLSKEELTEIKQTMINIIDNIDSKLSELFYEKEYYRNIRPIIECMYEFNLYSNAKQSIVSMLEKAMSPVLQILVKYKYENPYNKYFEHASFEKPLIDLFTSYGTKCVEYLKLIIEIDDVEKEKAKKEAEDLWNQA